MIYESDDIQAQDAGDEEDSNYARPFGISEDKPTSLGFRDPRIVVPPPWDTVRPSKFTRLKKWVRRHLYRPWQ